MKIKKFVALVLAGVMSLSLTVTAFAAEGEEESGPKNTVVISGSYAESDIAVVVPTTGRVVINPYGLGVSVKDSSDKEYNLTGQVMTEPMAIKNQSALTLDVGATVVATLPTETGAMKLQATSTKGTPDKDENAEDYVAPATAKVAFVQLEVATTNLSGADGDVADKIIEAYSKSTTWASAGRLTVGIKPATSEEKLVTLTGATVSDGEFNSYKSGSIAVFRLSGDCVTTPRTPWTEADTFEVTVVFSFTPTAA